MLLLMVYDEKKGNLCCCCLTILWDRKNSSLSQIILHRLTLTFSLLIYSIKYRKIWKENSYNWNLKDKHCWKVLTHSNCAGNIYLPKLQVCGHQSENVRMDDLGATVATFELINLSLWNYWNHEHLRTFYYWCRCFTSLRLSHKHANRRLRSRFSILTCKQSILL